MSPYIEQQEIKIKMSVVPTCPARLAFTREDFLAADFTVDGFLSRKTASVGLERLRDDLGVYLKVLRSAMIELINQDYADFVNLSTNLVGLDDSLHRISEPLGRFSERAKEVQKSLEDALEALKTKLAEREHLQAKRVALQNLEHVVNTLNKVERLLGLGEYSKDGEELTGDLVERVAADVNYLNFCVSKCAAPSFVQEISPRLQVIGDRLQASLETQLLEAVSRDNRDALRRCLRVYGTVDKVSFAQALVRRKIVTPYLEDVITQQSLNEDPQGLKGLLQRVTKIIPTRMDLLLQLTQNQSGVLRDFNFLVESLWIEIVERFEENLGFVFSAGDPDKFHLNYSTTLTWLDEFERKLGDVRSIEKFRSIPSYTSFMGRWNLSIYFQIRQQEIAMPVELSMENIFEVGTGSKFHLAATETVLTSIKQCWDPTIFLPALTHRFWKLTLQILARYAKAASCAMLLKPEETHDSHSSMSESRLKSSATSAALALAPGAHGRMTHSRSASDQGSILAAVTPLPAEDQVHVPMSEDELIRGLVFLHLDIANFNLEQSYILNDIVLPLLPTTAADYTHLLRQSLTDGFEVLTSQLAPIVKRLVDIITARCLPYLKQVSDIPRLYRRTNRDLPSKPCTYLTSLLAPIQTFHTTYSNIVARREILNESIQQMFGKVCDQYLMNVSDVLAAVQKMEESLQRLKKVRGHAAAAESKVGGMSDDEKIRLQLFVDVQHLVKVMQTLGVDRNLIPAANELDKLVKEATKTCYEDYVAKMGQTN